mmetsp:Transcript_18200/g.70354  ORF Transcript_18200/g.70354 Transcript_18200/m.70354 type:complete len:242 (-) Transcript_18200:162-887(-)
MEILVMECSRARHSPAIAVARAALPMGRTELSTAKAFSPTAAATSCAASFSSDFSKNFRLRAAMARRASLWMSTKTRVLFMLCSSPSADSGKSERVAKTSRRSSRERPCSTRIWNSVRSAALRLGPRPRLSSIFLRSPAITRASTYRLPASPPRLSMAAARRRPRPSATSSPLSAFASLHRSTTRTQSARTSRECSDCRCRRPRASPASASASTSASASASSSASALLRPCLRSCAAAAAS